MHTHTPFKLIMSRDFERKWQEKRSRRWGRDTEQVWSMQVWPGEKPQSRRMGQRAVNTRDTGKDRDVCRPKGRSQ